MHAAVDTLGHLLALCVSPANEDDREQVEELCEQLQEATGENVELTYVDQGYTGERASGFAAEHGIRLEVVKHEKPSAASCSCRKDGWWSGTSRGHRAFGGW